MRRLSLIAIPLLLGSTACLDDTPTQLQPQFARSDAATGPAGAATYHVTLENLTQSQAFTPPLAVTHRQSISIFQVGEAASFEVQQIAENGKLDPLLDALQVEKHAEDVVVTEGATVPPVLPGETVEFDISTDQGAKYLSFLSMLICTNDGFTGIDSARLPRDVGSSTMIYTASYDAGTEMNTEDFTDLVPPCPVLSGVETDDPGTDMSDPTLAENGVIHAHAGIIGTDDLDPAIHGWSDPVAKVTIQRTN